MIKFPFDNLKFVGGVFEFKENFELHIEFELIEINGEKVRPLFQFFGSSNLDFQKAIFSDGYFFTKNDPVLEFCGASIIYFESTYVPAHLKFLKVQKFKHQYQIESELFIDCEEIETSLHSQNGRLSFKI